MSHGPSRIPSKGKCIYCGKTETELTDEHFLPLSLGGQHVIDDASCLQCANITKKFEQDVAREMWGDARISYDAPSRRKKERPTHIKLQDPERPGRTVKVPYSEYPAALIFYKMQKAGMLLGAPEDLDISGAWQVSAVHDDEKAKGFEEKFGIKHTVKFRHVPISFGRLLAKIGYGQVLWELELDEFRPLVIPYILGTKSNVSYIVGGTFDIPPQTPGIGYNLRTAVVGDMTRILLIALVRLYANLHSPIYHVVVGDVLGGANVKSTLAKLKTVEPDLSLAPSSKTPAANDRHWQPTFWPLP
jgi:HNH endonuclease